MEEVNVLVARLTGVLCYNRYGEQMNRGMTLFETSMGNAHM